MVVVAVEAGEHLFAFASEGDKSLAAVGGGLFAADETAGF